MVPTLGELENIDLLSRKISSGKIHPAKRHPAKNALALATVKHV
jgi:hypothetical protein